MKMREDNGGDVPSARTSSDLNSPAATHSNKKGNISSGINSDVRQRSKRWSQRSLKDTHVVGVNIRKSIIRVHKWCRNMGEWWRSMGAPIRSADDLWSI